jgi:hypothetical protein
MELCSLEDAFPDIKNNSNNSEKSKQNISDPSREERRAQRKKAKKCKGPPLTFLNAQDDVPDPLAQGQPALKRLGEIPAFTSIEDAYRDLSENSFEGFKMPCLPASNATFTDAGLPDYFGNDDEDDIKGFAHKEGFATMLESSDLKTNTSDTFDYDPVKTIPDPELNVNWKPTTHAKANTAYYRHNSGYKPAQHMEPYMDTSKVQPAEERVGTKGMGLKAEHALAEEKRKSIFLPPRAHADPDSMRELMATQMKELERRMGSLRLMRNAIVKMRF